MSAVAEQKGFYGWSISIAAFFTFGLAVGIPYYGMGFYYDYYQKAFGWTRPEMTLGFPLAVVLTLWVGPVIMHRYSPRILMMIGAGLTALAFIGFSTMTGNLMFYYGMWTLYTVGYILSGPIAHQIIISQWFKRHRGKAMAATYLGVGVFGGLVVKFFAAPITQATNFQNALFWTGIAVLLVIPIAFFVLKDKPSDIGQTPDGLPVAAHEVPPPSRTVSDLLRQPSFWLLMVGSLCSIGAIGSINFHMKLVFKDQGFTDQKTLDTIFGNANLCILFSSIGGRIAMGYLADRFSKKYVMVTTYFLVAATIPLLFLVRPETPEYVYLFAILFGFGMGADYMLIPLMAAEQFGVNTLARAMAIILPADTIGQTWFPYLVSQIREGAGSYGVALNIVFAMAALGAAAVFMLPSHGKKMKHFSYKNLDQLKQDAEQRTQFVRFETDKEKLKQLLGRKVPVGKSITLGNSMAIHPMEGCDSDLDGNPDELTWRRYERFAAGGAKLIWFEATAVRRDGRANARQLWLHEGNVDAYAKLLSRMLEIHKERFGTIDDLLIPIQLTHSGRYSYPNRIIAYHNPLIDAKTSTPASQAPIGDEELEQLEDVYLAAAKLAWKAGFRAIDLKVTHGYLLAELMGAKTREGRYGGSLENRTRFIRNVVEKVKAEFGDEMLIAMRLGCFDSVPYRKNEATTLGEPLPFETPYPYGWGVNPEDPLSEDLTEVKQAIGWFKDWGVKLLNVSIGCPYYNPHIGRPFEKPDEGNYEMPEHPLLGVDRHFRISGELQQAFPDLPMVGTGYSWLQIYALNAAARNIEQGRIQIFGIGRNALSYPDFAVDALEKGALDEIRVCKTLTYCTFLMRQKNHPLGQFPAGCPPFDKLVYGPIMKQAREVFRSQK